MNDTASDPHAPAGRGLRILLAASGGGHLRQLLDVEPAWAGHTAAWVTEDTALSRSLAASRDVRHVAHVALGQGRLGAPLKMAARGLRNLVQSIAHVTSVRPDVVISTGAGSAFATLLWARLFGAHVIVIESFARFDHPSAFGRIAGPFAHERIIQSAALQPYWPDAKLFDPLRILDGAPRPAKRPLLFATVGATLPFDRLVNMVAELKARGGLPEDVLIQTGEGGARPDGVACVETLPFETVRETLQAAEIVVCHGGTGSLVTALRAGCRVVAVPRRFALGEHYDDHQAEITRAFAAKGLIEIADTADELAAAIARLRSRPAVCATTDHSALTAHLAGRMVELAARRRSRPRP